MIAEVHRNVYGEPLIPCCAEPSTGFLRSGSCEVVSQDWGNHSVCAVMTREFLAFTLKQGNDLSSPAPDLGFPGLREGDRWCLCASRWQEAFEVGKAPPVIPEATHEAAPARPTAHAAAWRIDDLSGINLASVGRFIEQADAGRGAVAMAARTPEAVQAREPLFNLVHGPGVDADRFARLLPEWLDELGGLVELGLIHVEDGWCRLSDDGGFWAYNIASMLGEAIRQHTEAA